MVKFGISCLRCLKRPRDGLKIAQDGFLEATLAQFEPKLIPSCLDMGSSWPQVASSWAQVGSKLPRDGVKWASGCLKLGLSWIQVGAGWAQNQLQEAPGGSPQGSWEGPGMVLEPRGAPGGPRGAKMAPRAFKMTQN